ncbi:hypothetical protein CDAR_65371 [Caerostris darwini]|uniref:Uncharacterized protein n=1 Tax=Caerostris darwini TaxID=1538125 RepID=A0AAV4W822_9ARAC|nr:hypothetical protein CDAR_65371 [Caerostris darwini]
MCFGHWGGKVWNSHTNGRGKRNYSPLVRRLTLVHFGYSTSSPWPLPIIIAPPFSTLAHHPIVDKTALLILAAGGQFQRPTADGISFEWN